MIIGGSRLGGLLRRTIPVIAPTNLQITAYDYNSVDLSWTDNSLDETGFSVERRVGAGAWAEIGTTLAGVVTYTDNTVVENVTYSWRVRAVRGTEYSGYSNTVTQLIPIAAPSALTVTHTEFDHVDLSWTDNSGVEDGFSIERQLGAGAWGVIDTVGAGITVYTDNTVAYNTAYSYRVRAYVGAVFSDYSNTATTTTLYPTLLTCVTVGAETLTIQGLTVSANTTIQWGDGGSDTYNGAGTRTHNYAGAGTWTVRVSDPTLITTFDLRDAKATITTTQLGRMTNVTTVTLLVCKVTGNSAAIAGLSPTTFNCTNIGAGSSFVFNSADLTSWNPSTSFALYDIGASRISGQFDSADLTSWTPTVFYLYNVAGLTGTFNSIDLTTWTPTNFRLYSMFAGFAGSFDTDDISGWNPTFFYLYSMPVLFTITITANAFDGWLAATQIYMQNNSLVQAQVDQILDDLYDAFPTRTGVAGTINVAGTNAAPSGILQAACPPTTGKECAYELANDSCGVSANHWATVTITP